MGRARLGLVILALTAGIPQPAMGQPMTGQLALDPQNVEIDLFFKGATIAVRAEVPAGYEAAVRMMSHPEPQELKRLGKRAGVLWMSVGNIKLEGIPAVYQVLTSAPLAAHVTPSVLREWLLGYDSLIPDRVLEPALRAELVGLKEHEGLFAVHEGLLAREAPAVPPRTSLRDGAVGASSSQAAGADTPERLRGFIRLPACAPAGDYSVDLIGFKDHRAVRLASTTLHVEHVGAVKELRRLAIEHGLAYGIAASLIAIVAGLLTGLLFRPKSDQSH